MHRSMGGNLHHSMELAAMRVAPDAGGTVASGFGKSWSALSL
jgi:hypothetical protein